MIAARTSVLAALEARVAENPWRTVGGAFLLGAWLGAHPPRAPRNPWVRAVFATIGSIAVRAVREIAFRELLERAHAAPER